MNAAELRVGWQMRKNPCVVGATAWVRPPDQRISLPQGLNPRDTVTIVHVHEKSPNATVCRNKSDHFMVDRAALDCGTEYRIACPWLPEDHPKVQAYLLKKIVQLEMVDPRPN